jgi:hypothetical protein
MHKRSVSSLKKPRDEVYEHEVILSKVYLVYDKWVGNDSVFPLSNGAPKIMTKFKEKPYSYELLPEYLHGEKKFLCVKAMNWEGKTATCSVIRGFVKATPVVERCSQQPLCISRLIIAPKFAPGQEKSDLDHGFRVCVNALVNKCLKPYGSTTPLAVFSSEADAGRLPLHPPLSRGDQSSH